MARIRGHYEWDDDDLTPGRKKEGGLHQNLFDADGNLRGSARFVPEEDTDPEPVIITQTVYIPLDERRRTQQDDALAEFVADVVSHLARRGYAAAAPIVAQWIRETAVPSLAARGARMRERRARRKARRTGAVAEGSIVDSSDDLTDDLVNELDGKATGASGELAEAKEEQRLDMSQAEAQARYLAALAARAFSEEQMRLVADANIVDGDGVAELERSLAALPADQLKALIQSMATNPGLLQEHNLAELASILGRRTLGGCGPVISGVNALRARQSDPG